MSILALVEFPQQAGVRFGTLDPVTLARTHGALSVPLTLEGIE